MEQRNQLIFAALQGLLSCYVNRYPKEVIAQLAVDYADAVINKLNKDLADHEAREIEASKYDKR